MRRSSSALAVLATLALPMAAAAPAWARSPRAHTVTFTSSFTDEGTHVRRSPECHGHTPDQASIPYDGVAELRGDLKATDTYCGFMSYDIAAQSVVGEGWDELGGALPGCGVGTLLIHQYDYRTSPTFFGPSTGRAHLTLRWDVVQGSGTGDFAGATGAGTAYADFDPPLDAAHPLAVPNTGAYTGTLACPRGH